jgi:uncharacterized protein (TIGR04255 family)
MAKDLQKKPLVEAILEIRWALETSAENTNTDFLIDPYYRIMIGRLFDRVSTDYSEPVELPAATVPDEMSPYVVKHQFRKAKDAWPLIQIGPGILTLNDTENYTWVDFRQRSIKAYETLIAAYPRPEKLKIISMDLRYIDAIEFDYSQNNIYHFMR